MEITFRPYREEDTETLMELWNDVIADGMSFPQTEPFEREEFSQILRTQTAVVCMYADGKLAGYFTLHPNIPGRCSHIANISYLIRKEMRGKHLGRYLVGRSVEEAQKAGFRGIQFNGVGAWNKAAIHLYQEAGFQILATIPGGFLLKDGTYSDIYIMYRSLLPAAEK